MTEQIPTGSAEYLSYVFEVMSENEQFLRKNALAVYEEIVGLTSDAMADLSIILNHPNRVNEFVRRAMFYFFELVLMPRSYAIWLDCISGNLPACFVEMRSILESLVKCYLADLRYPDQGSFQERLRLLDAEKSEVGGNQVTISISKRMKEIGTLLHSEKDFVTLWGKLSYSWVHARGMMDQLVSHLNKSDVPAWALVVPMNYRENDLVGLNELRERLIRLRDLLRIATENYRQQIEY